MKTYKCKESEVRSMKWKKMAVFLVVILVFSLMACSGRNQENDSVSGNTNQNTMSGSDEDKKSDDWGEDNVSENGNDNGKGAYKEGTHKAGAKEDGDAAHDGEGDGIFGEKADLEGSVYEFSDTGFLLSPAEVKESGEGVVMSQSAPGAEDVSKLVTITYENDCIFRLVVMDASSLREISREDTTSDSIKKQTQVMVYGSCQDTTHWRAEKIVILRWQVGGE